MSLSDHAIRNREAWTRYSVDYVESGRKSWASSEIYWGVFSVPESRVHALGDLRQWKDKDSIELGCGTGYVSSWLHRVGMRPTGIDVTPAQLDTARRYQKEFGIDFPLIEGSAEDVPLPDASFDLAISEYGASIWCDPNRWIREAARLLRPGGSLIFLRNSTVATLCIPDTGPAQAVLVREWHEIRRQEFDGSVEFQSPPGEMIRILRSNGFVVEDIIDVFPAPDSPPTHYEFMTLEWALKWPCEEFWVCTRGC